MTWNSEYWDLVTEYFWSPDWLGCMRIRDLCPECKKRRPSKERYSEKAVIKRLRRREESLNRVINIFLRLAPDQLVCRLFSIPFDRPLDDQFKFIGAEVQKMYCFDGNVTQQDVFLVGSDNILCVELKLGAKSELMQIAKYALLSALEEKSTRLRASVRLIYLTPERPFAKIWKEGFQNESDLRSAVHRFNPLSECKKSLRPIFAKYAEAVSNVIGRMEIGFMTYAEASRVLKDERANLKDEIPAEQTLGRLIDGMLAELEDRSLLD